MGRRQRSKPDYENIARLEAELDSDGDGLLDALAPEPLPVPEPPQKREMEMTAEEATARLEQVARSRSGVEAVAAWHGQESPGPMMTFSTSAYAITQPTQHTEVVRSPYSLPKVLIVNGHNDVRFAD